MHCLISIMAVDLDFINNHCTQWGIKLHFSEVMNEAMLGHAE